uniref:Uncharacterized protein n=1 Tax=Oryza punctata TaxID=4537 RepID=A0A0E0KMH9_ORYPU|nr:hypothetical protein [Oryza punctata]
MGDKKQIKLKVRGASETEVKNVLRQEFKESIDYRNCSRNPESSSLKLDVRGTVDVGKLYERLKKMASSVKIESVIPDDVKAEIERYKKNLETMKKQKEDLESKLRKKREEKKALQADKTAAEKEQQRLKTDKEHLNLKVDTKRKENRRLEEENKKLQRKIKDFEQKHKGGTSIEYHGVEVHQKMNQMHQEVHMHQVVRKLKISENDHGNANGRGHEQLMLAFGHGRN